MEFLQSKEFMQSLGTLSRKGMYTRAVEQVWAVYGKVKAGHDYLDATKELGTTNHGETRVPNCVKYDLQGRARLVTAVSGGVCVFLFAGTHDDVDNWLDRNKGLDFVAHRQGGKFVLSPVRGSTKVMGDAVLAEVPNDFTEGKLIDRLPARYIQKLLDGLPEDLAARVKEVDTYIDDTELVDLACEISDSTQSTLVYDTLGSLRGGDVVNAKLLIDRFRAAALPVSELEPKMAEELVSSDQTVRVQDVDIELFKHFFETATFEQWMLYLHPAQRERVDQDFKGPARLSGVSGSGKTCVIVHRALRLAETYTDEPVLVLTLSSALTALINRLIDAARGERRPKNLVVTSVWELCYQKLLELEPEKRDYYSRHTIAKNPHAVTEHVEDIWTEYFYCQNNNNDADVLFDLIKSLAIRGVYGSEYIKQELDYVRSALSDAERSSYLAMERTGRVIPLLEQYRKAILDGLVGWERKMTAVGVIDDLGIVGALYRHIEKLKPVYRCTLIDEVQDLGTLELSIIRKLTVEGENDLFMCGDAAQSIHTKYSDLKSANIETAGRSFRLNQNYRNSRQILEAAHSVLERAMANIPKSLIGDIEVLPPDFANFSSPRPMLMRERSLKQQILLSVSWIREVLQDYPGQRGCIAIAGFSQRAIAEIARQLKLAHLSGEINLQSGQIYVSDLEQTKGFEFDVVVICNCSSDVLPQPNLPEEESFRDLCKLYVAMTRAKRQLIITYTGTPSRFIEGLEDKFEASAYGEHGINLPAQSHLRLPPLSLPRLMQREAWELAGRPFIKTRDAVGLSEATQATILRCATGRELIRGKTVKKQFEWKRVCDFVAAIKNPTVRSQALVSEEVAEELRSHIRRTSGLEDAATQAT